MQIFLKEIAKQIIDEHGSDLSDQHIVFPNRRSVLYFRHYLSQLVEKPVLAPKLLTINELFSELGDTELSDPLLLIFKLYEAYLEIKGGKETFDEFYFWGEMIINDFDDIDKYFVNHGLLFQNLKDLRDIDAKFGGLEPEIIEIIRKFWQSFDPGNITSEKEDFLAVWDILIKLYDTFKMKLRQSKLAYEGMIMRDVIESIRAGKDVFSKAGKQQYHFIGFNALNKCEKELLTFFKRAEKAKFYWDYDNLYQSDKSHEAGFFIRDNIQKFGQNLKGTLRFDNLLNPIQPKNKWEVYKAPSDVAQAKLIPDLIDGLENVDADPNNTAIVLADENMLMPVLNSIPDQVKEVNITMGYPLFQTPVYSLINLILGLQRNIRSSSGGDLSFYHNDVSKLLSHQYITYAFGEDSKSVIRSIRENNLLRIGGDELALSDFFALLFSRAITHRGLNTYLISVLQEILRRFNVEEEDSEEQEPEVAYQMQQEYLYIIIKALKQLDLIFSSSAIELGQDIYKRLVDRAMKKLIVPFSGEPLKGLQVMGILETRALDFENIIFISVNEGVLPRGSAGNSYIPYNLRMAFGLPTVKHQDSIYAYYFYRLIQRSKKVRFIYNSSSSGLRTGEMSRFLLQLKYSSNLDTKFIESKFNIVPPPVSSDVIRRDKKIQSIIKKKYLTGEDSKMLSPSALNTWITCRMRFYYRYILGLTEQEEVLEEVDSAMFGTILHDAMNRLYSPYKGEEINSGNIDALIANEKLIKKVVEKAFRENFMNNNSLEISGKNLIITSVIENMIVRILAIDRKNTPIHILELEKLYTKTLKIKVADKILPIKLGGTIDRIDRNPGGIRILDYKSGKDSLFIDSLESLTDYNIRKRNSAAFQTFVYSLIYENTGLSASIRPSLYPVRSIYEEHFSDIFIIKRGEFMGEILNFSAVQEAFSENLSSVLSDIVSPDTDFDMTSIKESCLYCSFIDLCGRQDVK